MSSKGVSVEGTESLFAALLAMTPAVDSAATAGIADWASQEVPRIRAAARAQGRQSAMAAQSVRSTKSGHGGRITAGGPGRLPNNHGTYGDVFFGAEFGSAQGPRTKQFPPWDKGGHWFFPTIGADQVRLQQAAEQGLEAAARVWAG